MEPNVRSCRPPPPSPSSAVIDAELMAVSTTTTATTSTPTAPRSESAGPKISSSSLSSGQQTNTTRETLSKKSRSSGVRKSRTTTPTTGGSGLKLRQAASDAVPSQSERNNNNSSNKGNASEMHRLQLRHANSEFTESGSAGPESFQSHRSHNDTSSSNYTVRANSNLEGSPSQYSTNRNLGLKSANNSNRSSGGGRYIETADGGSSKGGVEMAARPQSALAGTIGSSRSPDRIRVIASGSTRGEHQTRSKTTRVRINSTSEQIQDPNWLIRMSRELELQQQSKKSHLKLLHRKLKLTITGHHQSSTDSNSNSQAQGSAANAINNGSNNNNNNTANNSDISNREAQDNKFSTSISSENAFSAPPVPQTPVKVPVSILKQRTVSATTPTSINNSPAFHSQQNHQYFKIPSNRTKTPVHVQHASSISQPASKSGKQQQVASNKQQQKQQPQSQSASSVISPVIPPSYPASSVAFQKDLNSTDNTPTINYEPPTKQKQITQQQQQQESLTTSKPAPICADGQVKVSGWKRNNLLAKTLSHFDEIRGNQRPIFVPTKIMLPTESLAQNKHSATAALATTVAATITDPASSTNMTSFKPGKSKFAEIVREAVSKKNQLISSSSSKQTSSDTTGAKRASYGGSNDYSAGDSNKEMSQHQANTRAISAEPSVVIHNSSLSSSSSHHQASYHETQVGVGPPEYNLTQHRSSSTGTRDSFGSASPTLQVHTLSSNQGSKQQQVIGKKHSGGFSGAGGGSSPKNSHPTMHVSPKLVSQLLMSNAANSALFEASSSRAFKLQHKNQQVLQHLKHQLDPESSSHAYQHNQSGNHTSNSTHIKDWKRLTNKLSLLTSSRNFSKSSSPTSSKNLSSVKDDSESNNNRSGSTNGATPLRLTVSNQESGASGAHHDGNADGSEKHASSPFSLRFLQTKRNSNSQQNSPSSILQLPETGPRRLSSSSMVVQSSSGGSGCNNRTGIGAAASVGAACGGVGARDAQTTCRRSSDSEAYRVSSNSSSSEPKHTPSPQSSSCQQNMPKKRESKRGSAISLLSNNSNNSEKGTNRQPIVVYRNDLLQLLQVTARPAANGNRKEKQHRGSTNSSDAFESTTKESNEFSDSNLSWSIKNKHRHSLQLNESSQVTATTTTTTIENKSSKVIESEMEKENGNGNGNESKSAELISFSEAKMNETKGRAELPCMGRSISMNSVEIQLLLDSEGVQNEQDKQFNKKAVRSSLSDTPMLVSGCATIKQLPQTTVPAVCLLSQTAETMRDLGEKDSKGEERERVKEVNDEDLCLNETTKSMSSLQRSSDLSWVVKKTSKVAFFQRKLRKMRWHSKQRKHPDSELGGSSGTTTSETTTTTTEQNKNKSNSAEQWPQIAPVNQNEEKQLACQPEAITAVAKNEDQQDGDSNGNDLEIGPSDVFMDPTLIGDAIEIFLRNTMQQQQQKDLRRESTGETPTKKGGVSGSKMDRRYSSSIETNFIGPPSYPLSELSEKSSDIKPSTESQASVPQEAKIGS